MKTLLDRVAKLTPELRTIFDRIYQVTVENVEVVLPPAVQARFGTGLAHQEITTIKNLILGQQTVFSPTRAQRPEPPTTSEIAPPDPFDTPLETAPSDSFGRLENDGAFTANNLFKAAPYHSLIVLKPHDPQQLSQKDIHSGLELATQWFTKAKTIKPALDCGLLIWNYLGRAGASITHPHFQVFALSALPPRLALERTLTKRYQTEHGSNYIEDTYAIHEALGLARRVDNIRLFVRLTPFKDREVMLFGFLGERLSDNEATVAKILNAYRQLTESFDALLLSETHGALPLGFVIDRGSLSRKNSDIGSLELYAFSVVAFDPFDFAAQLFSALGA